MSGLHFANNILKILDIYISVHNHIKYNNYKITGLMRLSTRSSVDLMQSIFTDIMLG